MQNSILHSEVPSFKARHLVMQTDSSACGMACLHMICRYYGMQHPEEAFSDKYSAVSTDGVSLLCLEQAAQSIGFKTRCLKASIGYLLNEPAIPCILHWNQNHFVVLYKIKRGKTFYVADPAKGLVKYTLEEFKQRWISFCQNDEGILMQLEPTPTFCQNTKNNKAKSHATLSLPHLLGQIKENRTDLLKIAAVLAAATLLQLALPFLTQGIVDYGIKKQNITLVWLILLGQLILMFSRSIADVIRSRTLLRISLRVNLTLVSSFLRKLIKLPMSYFQAKQTGDIMQRINDHNRVIEFLTQQALGTIFSVFSISVFSVILFVYNPLLFLIFLFGSVACALWTKLFLNRRKTLDYELFELQASNSNKTYEFITAIQEIKLQNCEQRRCEQWENLQTELYGVQLKSLKLQQTQEIGSLFIREAANMAITVTAASAVIQGQITLGMMLSAQYIAGQLNSPVSQLLNSFCSLQDVKLSLQRINEVHRREEEDNEESETQIIAADGIRINHLTFKYDPYSPAPNLSDVTLTIPYGKTTAIVGASGSGKTTLIRMLLGYYPIEQGNVRIGQTDINKLNKKLWRLQCGTVMQNSVIFSESIARNIAVADGEIDHERLLKASEIACIKDFIISLPLGFETLIGPGGIGLSQGQRQRILIARAVYKAPDFVFFDEATNSLDANTERNIVMNLNNFFKGHTVVVAAHRLSTVRNANQIIVLSHGKVVETGNHKTLIAKQGEYYRLVKNQLELG